MKKIIFLLILTLLPLVASAYDAEIDGIYYNIITKAKLATVTSGDTKYTGKVTIPATVTYNGVTCNVTEIEGSAFYECYDLTSVTIGNNVTEIGDSAFYKCSGLTSITIPNSMTVIDRYAFCYCSGLKSITIGNGVTDIGDGAFYDCSKLTAVHITDIAAWCKIEFSSNPLSYAHHLYLNGSEVKDLIIPNSVTSIGVGAFRGCSDLTSVTIPNSVTSIGEDAFFKCSGLKSVTIPNSVTEIGGYAFSGCSGLTSVTIGSGVTSIGLLAFSGCSKLTSVHITDIAAWCKINWKFYISNGFDSRTYMETLPGYYANHLFMNGKEIKDLIIPDGVTSIGDGAFYGFSCLTSVTIPNSVKSIGYAFDGCSNLTSVHITDIAAWCNISFQGPTYNPLNYASHLFMNGTEIKDLVIPTGVTKVGIYAFYNCSGLTSVTIPNSVTSIGYDAFKGCSALTSVTIGKSVASVGSSAFANCKELTEVYCYATKVPSISSYAFENSYIEYATLHVPASSLTAYQSTSPWSGFGSIEGILPEGTSINETNFPDANFRNWVLSQSYGSDGVLTDEEIASVTSMSVESMGIRSLKGIEYFTALKSLCCSYNNLTVLDISKCVVLTKLECFDNKLTSLDLSKNTALTELECYCNQIKGEAMDALIESLPRTSQNRNMLVIYNENEGNVMTNEQVAAVKAKGWSPKSCDGSDWRVIGLKVADINETNFPDENFRNWILSQDYGSDGVLTDEEITGVNRISLPNRNIKDMKGIEYFTELTSLECYSNMLTTLDLSNNTKLRALICYANKLTSLDLSKNTTLTNLTCSYNQLASLNLSNNSTLRNLFCQMNNIEGKAMDALVANLPTVSSGTLGVIYNDKDGNVMTTTQVAAAKAKGWSVQCTSDGSTWQDYAGIDPEQVSAYAMLENNILTFYYDNKRTERSGVRCNITKSVGNSWGNQDADGNIKKVVFDTSFADYHQITTTAGWFYGCTNLTEIEGLEYLNTENITNMYAMFAECERLTSLDLSNFNTENVTDMSYMFYMCSSLKTIYVKADWDMSKVTDSEYMFANCISLSGQAGTWYDYTKMDNTYARIDEGAGWPGYFTLKKPSEPTVETVEINETNFPDENFRSYLLSQSYGEDGIITDEEIPNIKEIDVREKSIQSLKGIDYFAYLKKLHCERNSLTSLDVAKNKELTVLYCHNNQITSLDISNNTALTYLSCDINKLTTLDVSKNTILTDLHCSNNQITSLDVSNNTQLEYFSCHSNKLTSLDVSKNTSLIYLHFGGNEIKSIDLTNNTSLRELWLWRNQITTLDLSKNTALKYLYCFNNQLVSLDLSNNTALKELECYCNQIKGEAMDALVASLPTVSSGMMQVIYNNDEGNEMTVAQVAVAKTKGWIPQYYDSSDYSWKDYAGSEPTLRGDVNGDGEIGMPDVMFIVNYILGTPAEIFDAEAADVNLDGEIGMPDVMFIVNYILDGRFPDDTASRGR